MTTPEQSTFMKSFSSAINSLTPLWSANILAGVALGNEYNMIITLILGQFTTKILQNINDVTVIIICIVCSIIALCIKYSYIPTISLFHVSEECFGYSYHNDMRSSIAFYMWNDFLLNQPEITMRMNLSNQNIHYKHITQIIQSSHKNWIPISALKGISVKIVVRDDIGNCSISIKSTLKRGELDKLEQEMLKKYMSDKPKIYEILYLHEKEDPLIPISNEFKMVHKQLIQNEIQVSSTVSVAKGTLDTQMKTAEEKSDEIYAKSRFMCIYYEIVPDVFITIGYGYASDYHTNTSGYTCNIYSKNKKQFNEFMEMIQQKYDSEMCIYQQAYMRYEGYEGFDGGNTGRAFGGRLTEMIDYCYPIIALNYYLVHTCNINPITISKLSNGSSDRYWFYEKKLLYKIGNLYHHKITYNKTNTIHLNIARIPEKDQKVSMYQTPSTNVIYSLRCESAEILHEFTEKMISEFTKIKINIENVDPALYHFVYSGNNTFISKILSSPTEELYETFDHIHNEHSDVFKKQLDLLKNKEFYKKRGLKRKLGFLFSGVSGSGKTSSVVAMALHDKRHIMEINFSAIKTQSELENIINKTEINGIKFTKEQLILLFDEMEVGLKNHNRSISGEQSPVSDFSESVDKCFMDKCFMKIQNQNKNQNENQNQNEDKNDTKIDISKVLSILDGIGNYNGLVIIGTTNYKEQLDASIYRSMRLTLYEFQNLRKCDAIAIIEQYFDCCMTNEQKELIIDRQFVPAKLIHQCITYCTTLKIDEFMKRLVG